MEKSYLTYKDFQVLELQEAGIGCNVGDKYIGAISYADDLNLLAPSQRALNKMISICEEYANDFCIKFNGSKSKLMIFGNTRHYKPKVMVEGEEVSIVDEMIYLGHCINSKKSDASVKYIIKDFNCKVNSFLGDFGMMSSKLKNFLFDKYCTSFYGSNLCRLFDDNIMNDLYVNWRKAIRRIWGLPSNAHCRLLYHISGLMPPEILLQTRFCKFLWNGLNSNNQIVNFMFNLSLTENGILGRNIRHILYKTNCNMKNFYALWVRNEGGNTQ